MNEISNSFERSDEVHEMFSAGYRFHRSSADRLTVGKAGTVRGQFGLSRPGGLSTSVVGSPRPIGRIRWRRGALSLCRTTIDVAIRCHPARHSLSVAATRTGQARALHLEDESGTLRST
jgi:hypothetical protein